MSKSNYLTAIVFLVITRNREAVVVKYHRVKKTNRERFESFLRRKFVAYPAAYVNYYELHDRNFIEQVRLFPDK
jgi:hypothetical protein